MRRALLILTIVFGLAWGVEHFLGAPSVERVLAAVEAVR